MSEMMKLWKYLIEHHYNIAWIFNKLQRGHSEIIYRNQIIVYDDTNNRLWDAICHHGSYGYEKGLLEIYGCICDDVVGYQTADDVINRIKKYKEEQHGD